MTRPIMGEWDGQGQQRSLSTRHLHETHMFSWPFVYSTCHNVAMVAMVYCKPVWAILSRIEAAQVIRKRSRVQNSDGSELKSLF